MGNVNVKRVMKTKNATLAIMHTIDQIQPCHVKIVNAVKLAALAILVVNMENANANPYSLVKSVTSVRIASTYKRVNQNVQRVTVIRKE